MPQTPTTIGDSSHIRERVRLILARFFPLYHFSEMKLSLHEKQRRKAVLGPIIMMALGAIVFCSGAALYFWPSEERRAEDSPHRQKLEDFFVKDFGFMSIDRTFLIHLGSTSGDIDKNIEIKTKIFRDFTSNTEFIAVFIPPLTTRVCQIFPNS